MVTISTFNDFSTTASSNVDVNGISIQGTAAVQNFDNSFRELMAILRRDLDNGMVLTSKSANYTAVANDNNAVIRFSAAATLSLTAAATLGADWHCWVMADGGAVIIDPNASETINGATTITIPDGYSTLVICDGTNFRALEDYSQFATKLDAVQNWVDVASATTTDIGAAASQNVRITGTTTITGLGTVAAGTFRRLRFAGALTLTHNATSLILPNAANILTAAGDVAEFISEGSGNWRCIDYTRATLPASNFYAILQDQKSAGTNGGTPAGTGSWQTRTLNTEVRDPAGIVSLSSNVFTTTIPCKVRATAGFYQAGNVGLRIYDTVNLVEVIRGPQLGTTTASGSGATPTVEGFLPAGSYSLQYLVTTATANIGLGPALSAGTEVYATVILEGAAV